MSDFSRYNKVLSDKEQADMNRVQGSVMGNSSKASYPDPINGKYIAKVVRLEIVPKPETGVPCFYLRMKLIDGADPETKQFIEEWPGKNHPVVFRTLPIYGTKNDANCIGSVAGLASRMHEGTKIQFNGDYNQFARDIEALRGKIDDSFAYLIEYDKEDFNHIKIIQIMRNNSPDPNHTPSAPTQPVSPEGNPLPAGGVPQYPQAQPVPEAESLPFESHGRPPGETRSQNTQADMAPAIDAQPPFDKDGFIPMDGMPQFEQAPTSYPIPDSDTGSGWLDEFADEADELPFN